MLKINFNDVEPSQLAKDIVTDKLQLVIEKFPDLKSHKIQVTLSMENSLTQAGPDQFTVKVVISGNKYGGLILQKQGLNLYLAVDEVWDVISDLLNRKGDKARVKARNSLRKKKVTSQKISSAS